MMFGGGMMNGFGGMWIGMFFNLAVLVGIAFLIAWAVKRATGSNPAAGSQSPREILQVRYARGEITREQYQQMLQDLG